MFDWFESIFGSALAGSTFLIIGIVGAALLLVSLLLGGIFDFFDFGDGPLSLTTIAAFTTLFGFTAFSIVGAGVSTPMAALGGAGAGLAGGAIAWWLARLMRKAESTTSVSVTDLVGSEAIVTLQIPGGSGFGEISSTMHGERVSLTANSKEQIARGEKVVITATLSATAVKVDRA